MILLTGANGQLGQDFQKLFRQIGQKFIATDYRETDNCQALDITDKNALEAFVGEHPVEVIINCAAYNAVDQAEREPEKALALNCLAPGNLAKIAKARGLLLVTYSTDFVFDGTKQTPYREEDIARPLSVYGRSKYQGEREVLENYEKVFVIRTSWVFGMGNNNFNKSVIRWAQTNALLKIVDDQISAPTYSWDLAVFSWDLIQTGQYGLYHLTNRGQASKYDQAKLVLDRIGWQGELRGAKTEEFDLPAKRPQYSKLDSSKAEGVIGREMPEWTDAICRFLAEMKEAGEIE